jgi:ring-1,2-phenylacetyl-CoA epoxidase subunit PaaC
MPNPLIDYTLHLADTALIMAQRESAWCGHGPLLEQDIALTNIALDLLGQARFFYQYAAELINKDEEALASLSLPENSPIVTEDTLAYFRKEQAFKNLLLVELPNGHWGVTVLKHFFFSCYQQLLYTALQNSKNPPLAAIATKALKEVLYHVRWSSEWVIRLGDGTEESHQRMQEALEQLWPYTGELFIAANYELALVEEQIAPNPSVFKNNWLVQTTTVLKEATLLPDAINNNWENIFMHQGGKNGQHTEHFGYILTELQYLQRTYPGANW